MNILLSLEEQYYKAKNNKWFHYFAIFCRITLALGFIPSGIVKIMGERFTALPVNHPLGHYLEALHLTGYYYTFIGIIQVTAALFLLIPRTALLGAIMYFPVILNICILAYAVRFEGTRITTFMVLANLYLLCWDFARLKYILPFKQPQQNSYRARKATLNRKFPFVFFACVFATLTAVVVINHFLYNIRPGNSLVECMNSCGDNGNQACLDFCDCIYNQGQPLDKCVGEYEKVNERDASK
jgi:uncharacterized membrane protein YphA (DoxX/SURF4 family)